MSLIFPGMSCLFMCLTVQSLWALSVADPPAFKPRDWRVAFRMDMSVAVRVSRDLWDWISERVRGVVEEVVVVVVGVFVVVVVVVATTTSSFSCSRVCFCSSSLFSSSTFNCAVWSSCCCAWLEYSSLTWASCAFCSSRLFLAPSSSCAFSAFYIGREPCLGFQ